MPRLSDTSALPYLLAAILALCIAHLAWSWTQKRSTAARPPPGPPGLPIIGNAWDIPFVNSHLAYVSLAKKYGAVRHQGIAQADAGDGAGPTMQFRVLGKTLVVVSDIKTAVDLLEKRGAIYSGRPRLYMADEAGFTWHIMFMQHDEDWRVRRQMVHQTFNAKGTAGMHGMLRRTTLELARDLLMKPERFREHVKRSATANIIEAIYGIRVAGPNDPYVQIAVKAMDVAGVVILPGRNLIDTFPLLRYVPPWVPFLGQWTAEAHSLRQYPTAMLEVPYARAKDDLSKGTAQPCMVHENLELSQTDSSITEKAIQDACAAAYLGGSDTTVSAVTCFIMAMVLHPEYQRAAQAELDRVVGVDHLPDFADAESLPYIEALVRETYRRYPVVPLGLPHAAVEDDVYDGFRIKKGSTVMANIWAILHDEAMYPEPETFDPERWLKDGKIDESIQDSRAAVFGFGRRICPGRDFADASVFLTIATLLKCFDFGCYVENGVAMPPSGKIDTATTSWPAPFKCRITPRSESIAGMIDVALEACTE